MQFSEFHSRRRPVISFELYPPKTPEAETRLFEQVVPELLRLAPAFLTCTYGAGGSTREKTLEVVTRIKHDLGHEVAAHLTCVGASREQLAEYVERTRRSGIHNLVALRGDPPAGDTSFRPHPGGFRYARELIEFIHGLGGFELAAAGYPEGHPEAPDKYTDWQHCREKVEAGAAVIMTQLFYDNRYFFEFEDYLTDTLEVRVPIVPGVLPIAGAAQVKRFCGLCGATIPERVLARLETYADDNEACRQYGVELATEMCAELLARGVPGLHFYTLNRSASIAQILHNLQLAS